METQLAGFTNLILTLSVFYAGGYLVLKEHTAAWDQRGFEKLSGQWNKLFLVSSLVGYIVGLIAWWKIESVAVGIASAEIREQAVLAGIIIGILGYILFFTGYTDLFTTLAPREVTSLGGWTAFAIGIIGVTMHAIAMRGYYFMFNDPVADGWLQLGLWMCVPLLMFILGITIGGVGVADLKILVMVGWALAWWIGIGYMLWMFIIACILQVLAEIPGRFFKWGREVDSVLSGKRKNKKSRALPFIPALCLVFIVGPIIVM